MSLRTITQHILPDRQRVSILTTLINLRRDMVQARDPLLAKTREQLFPWTPKIDDPEMMARHLLLWAVLNRGAKIDGWQ